MHRFVGSRSTKSDGDGERRALWSKGTSSSDKIPKLNLEVTYENLVKCLVVKTRETFKYLNFLTRDV